MQAKITDVYGLPTDDILTYPADTVERDVKVRVVAHVPVHLLLSFDACICSGVSGGIQRLQSWRYLYHFYTRRHALRNRLGVPSARLSYSRHKTNGQDAGTARSLGSGRC